MVITLLLSSLLGSLTGLVLGLHLEMSNMTIGLFYILGGMTGVTLALMRAMSRDRDRKSTRLNSSHLVISYAVFCLKKKKTTQMQDISYQ